MEKTVKGATKIKLAAPKSKYVEPILSATRGGETGVADVFHTLQFRLRDSTWTIVFKSLIIVHLMIREGAPDTTLRYLAESPKRLAISQFTEVQTQGINIRRYYEYLLERVKAYHDTKTDFVRSGDGKIRSLTVDKGLLRQTEIVQAQIRALLKCDLLGGSDPDNEIAMTAFRLLTMDLLELFKVMNEGTINVLEHYFEMSKVDAERALGIYKTFARQTDSVVQYLSTARQYQNYTRLEVPKLKHAPTTLTSSLEDYLNDPDFDVNRRQYLAQQEAKRTGRPMPIQTQTQAQAQAQTQISQPKASQNQAVSAPVPHQGQVTSPPKNIGADLIDFFESIEQNQQPTPQQTFGQNQPVNSAFTQPQIYQQPQQPPVLLQQTGYNPFMQNFGQQPQQSQSTQPQQLQPDFTGAGFGGYGPQPAQQQTYGFNSSLSPIPQDGAVDFSQQQPFSPASPTQFSLVASAQALQPQPTSTNPFRHSLMPTGGVSGSTSPPLNLNRQSTNPFAKHNTNALQAPSIPENAMSPPVLNTNVQQQAFQSQMLSPTQQPTALQPQRTGTNPFAKSTLSPPAAALSVNVTGSTNPFRQSQFVNQQTGQGWQHSQQGTFGGFDINGVPTTSVFPRPGAQQQT